MAKRSHFVLVLFFIVSWLGGLFLSQVRAVENESANRDFFTLVTGRPDIIASAALTSQESINASSRSRIDSRRRHGPNDQVTHDPELNAARVECRGSVSGLNQITLPFPVKQSGHLVWIWEYYGSPDWNAQRGSIHTHKLSMLGLEGISTGPAKRERRRIEHRFHYPLENSSGWQIDVRPYAVGASTDGAGRGFDRITPYLGATQKTGRWYRHVGELRMSEGESLFSYRIVDELGAIQVIYEQAPLRLAVKNGGFNRFSPGWIHTSQSKLSEPVIHGWMRNAAVLWSESSVELRDLLVPPVSR